MNNLVTGDHLAASAAPLGSVLELTSAAIYATDRSGTITYYNEPAVELWGYRPVLGETRWCGSWRLFWPDGRPLPLDECPMAICLAEGRELRDVEIVVERPDGRVKHVIVNPRPMLDGRGKLLGAVNTLVDVSAEREAERAKLESDQFARQILASSQDCIKILDLEGRLQTINPRGCISLEIDHPAEAAGLSYYDFWKGEERDAAVAATQSALETGSGRFTARFKGASGCETIWDEIISVLRDPMGKASGFLVISRDVSEKYRVEAAMARRLEQQKSLAQIGALALSDQDFHLVLQKIVEILAHAVECPMTKVLEFADHADRLTLRAGIGWKDGLVGRATVGIDSESQAGYTLASESPVVVKDLLAETRFNGPQLLREHGVRSGMSVTIAGTGPRPFGVLGVHTPELRNFEPADVDFLVSVANVIAARARQESASERRKLLLREMAHRSGNLLQLANSVFLQTLRFTPDIEEAKDVFSRRLMAMTRANMAVASGGWSKTSLRMLAKETLEPFIERITLSGRDIVLPAELSFDIGLIWHELSTNSAKYGAFSRDGDGKVEISWSVSPETVDVHRLRLSWIDWSTRVTSKSARTGFGTTLLKMIVERKHQGRVRTETEPNFRCDIELVFRSSRDVDHQEGHDEPGVVAVARG